MQQRTDMTGQHQMPLGSHGCPGEDGLSEAVFSTRVAPCWRDCNYHEFATRLSDPYPAYDGAEQDQQVYIVVDGPNLQELHDSAKYFIDPNWAVQFRIMPGILCLNSQMLKFGDIQTTTKPGDHHIPPPKIIIPALQAPIAVNVSINWMADELENNDGLTLIAIVNHVPRDYTKRLERGYWSESPLLRKDAMLRMSYDFCAREGGCSVGSDASPINSISHLIRLNHATYSYYAVQSTARERPVRWVAKHRK